ncbi:MAG: hypothetical protein ACOWW1_00375 [archaeon]
MHPEEDKELIRLFTCLTHILAKKKKINRDKIPSQLLYEILNMSSTNVSKVFHNSAIWFEPEVAERLVEKGLIQKIANYSDEKYALTLTGVAYCIKKEYKKNFDEQFIDFLTLTDQKFNTTEIASFTWKEKLGALALILLSSTSSLSAVRLKNETNKIILAEVLEKTLTLLKKYNLVDEGKKLKGVTRGESIASAFMCRLNSLPRKTNHYYVGKDSEYYINIEKNGKLDKKRLSFVLSKIFDSYDPCCNYSMMNKELQEISQKYYHRIVTRRLNSLILLELSNSIRKYLQFEIMKMPMISENQSKRE